MSGKIGCESSRWLDGTLSNVTYWAIQCISELRWLRRIMLARILKSKLSNITLISWPDSTFALVIEDRFNFDSARSTWSSRLPRLASRCSARDGLSVTFSPRFKLTKLSWSERAFRHKALNSANCFRQLKQFLQNYSPEKRVAVTKL